MHAMQVAGAEVLVTQIIEQLADRIEATVFCLDALGELGEKLLEEGVPVIVLDRKPGLDRDTAKRLAAEVKARQIEVLHAHQYTPFFYSALSRILHRCKAKILFTEHGRHYPDIVSTKRRWANRLVLQRYADISTACCDFSAQALREIEGFPKAITLPNGVDLRGLPKRGPQEKTNQLRQKLGMQPGTPYAACIARFHPVKDHATLIRAWAKVHAVLQEARLLLVGGGEEREKIEQLITTLSETKYSSDSTPSTRKDRGISFSESIQFLGIRHDVPEILKAIDVFTLTSVSEAASLTLLEAMASECASVVTDVGGNSEHLREAIDGHLVPRADDQKLAERLIELLSNPDTAKQMGQSARKQVGEKFHLQNAVARYATFYASLSKLT